MRLDSYVFEKGFAQSRNKAAELIKEGSVWLNGKVERKSSVEVGENDTVDVEKIMQYVSRAGLKLRGFINELSLHVKGLEVLDIGFSFFPEFEGKGYAYESASNLKEIAKNDFGVSKLSAITSKENYSSQKLIEKLGLKFQKLVTLPDETEELMYYEN